VERYYTLPRAYVEHEVRNHGSIQEALEQAGLKLDAPGFKAEVVRGRSHVLVVLPVIAPFFR